MIRVSAQRDACKEVKSVWGGGGCIQNATPSQSLVMCTVYTLVYMTFSVSHLGGFR